MEDPNFSPVFTSYNYLICELFAVTPDTRHEHVRRDDGLHVTECVDLSTTSDPGRPTPEDCLWWSLFVRELFLHRNGEDPLTSWFSPLAPPLLASRYGGGSLGLETRPDKTSDRYLT